MTAFPLPADEELQKARDALEDSGGV